MNCEREKAGGLYPIVKRVSRSVRLDEVPEFPRQLAGTIKGLSDAPGRIGAFFPRASLVARETVKKIVYDLNPSCPMFSGVSDSVSDHA